MDHSRESLTTVSIGVPAVFLRVPLQITGVVSAIEMYERSRGDWVMRPSLHPQVSHAFVVSGGIVREVYRIRKWTEIDVRAEQPNPHRLGGRSERPSINAYRWRFDGEPDKALGARYVGQSIFLPGSNPVTWADNEVAEVVGPSLPIIEPLSR